MINLRLYTVVGWEHIDWSIRSRVECGIITNTNSDFSEIQSDDYIRFLFSSFLSEITIHNSLNL